MINGKEIVDIWEKGSKLELPELSREALIELINEGLQEAWKIAQQDLIRQAKRLAKERGEE